MKNELISNADIKIIGDGNIGEKARQLVEKTPTLRSIGFHTPTRIVLAEGFFDGFLQRNEFGVSLSEAEQIQNVENKVRNGTFSLNDFSTIQTITESSENTPLVIRSSAEGDARGTGIYKSEFSHPGVRFVRKAIQKVLASYFSADARTFRQDAKTGEGFGIIIEPLIGQQLDRYEYFFAPVLSGFGYTSTSQGESFVNVVPGIGGGVETRNGERLLKSVMERFDGSLQKYIDCQRDQVTYGIAVSKHSALLRTLNGRYSSDYSGRAYSPPARFGNHYQRGGVEDTSFDFKLPIALALHDLNLISFF